MSKIIKITKVGKKALQIEAPGSDFEEVYVIDDSSLCDLLLKAHEAAPQMVEAEDGDDDDDSDGKVYDFGDDDLYVDGETVARGINLATRFFKAVSTPRKR